MLRPESLDPAVSIEVDMVVPAICRGWVRRGSCWGARSHSAAAVTSFGSASWFPIRRGPFLAPTRSSQPTRHAAVGPNVITLGARLSPVHIYCVLPDQSPYRVSKPVHFLKSSASGMFLEHIVGRYPVRVTNSMLFVPARRFCKATYKENGEPALVLSEVGFAIHYPTEVGF